MLIRTRNSLGSLAREEIDAAEIRKKLVEELEWAAKGVSRAEENSAGCARRRWRPDFPWQAAAAGKNPKVS